MLTHLDSATSVPCSVLYDTKSERHQGGCDVPSLVCTGDDARAGCELSPPVGEFVLEVNDTQGMLVGATRYPFTIGNCPDSYYQRDAKCVVCPEHVTCPAGSTVASWQLYSGFWRTDDTSTDVRQCRFGTASCPGPDAINPGDDSNCVWDEKWPYCGCGYVGPLCSECASTGDASYFIAWSSGSCERCDDDASHAPNISLGVGSFAVILFFVFLLKSKKFAMCHGAYQRVQKIYRIGENKLSVILFACQIKLSYQSISNRSCHTALFRLIDTRLLDGRLPRSLRLS